MIEIDAKRGAVIGATFRLMHCINNNVGPTADWPIRITADTPEMKEELTRLFADVNKALGELIEP